MLPVSYETQRAKGTELALVDVVPAFPDYENLQKLRNFIHIPKPIIHTQPPTPSDYLFLIWYMDQMVGC